MNERVLRGLLEKYLTLKSSLGYSMRTESWLLSSFVRFVEDKKHVGPITAKLALDWACSTHRVCGRAGQAQRLSIARSFLMFVQASIPETEVPGSRLLARVPRSAPYIYSDTDIKNLMVAAQDLGPQGSLRPHTYMTLIGLLVSSGLRVGEARKLNIDDVVIDHKPALIHVRQTKFRKSRVVPIHSTTAEKLYGYAQLRHNIHSHSQAFFVSEQRRHLHYQAIWRAFGSLTRKVGLRVSSDQRRPTIHGLRHTFAVNCILAWYREGVDIRLQLGVSRRIQ